MLASNSIVTIKLSDFEVFQISGVWIKNVKLTHEKY